jgi:hypothetical protein
MKKTLLLATTAVSLGLFGMFAAQPAYAACTDSQTEIHVITRDVNGTLLPGVDYVLHKELTDPDSQPYLGAKIKSGTTDAGGQSTTCVSTAYAPYAINFYEYNKSYGNRVLWSDSMTVADGVITAELRFSYLNVTIRNGAGGLLKNMSFDIYEQAYDVDGFPIVDEDKINEAKLVHTNYTTGEAGRVRAYLGAGKYVVRIHGTGTSYFYLWEQDVEDSASTTLVYKLGTLRVVLEDGLGGLLKNRFFDLYTQDYDVRGKPIVGDLIASNLKVGTSGKYDAYLPEGKYALKIPGSISDSTYSSWRINVKDELLTTRTYRLSGLRVIIRNDDGLVKNARYTIGLQGTDAAGNPVVRQNVFTGTTGELGYQDVYLVPGRYVLVYGTNRVYFLDVFETRFTTVDWPRLITYRPRKGVILDSPIPNQLTVKSVRNAVFRGLPTIKHRVGKTFKVNIRHSVKPYAMSFTYQLSVLREQGINPNKLRIAYYNSKTKEWSLVGRNSTSRKRVSVSLSTPGTLTLVETK